MIYIEINKNNIVTTRHFYPFDKELWKNRRRIIKNWFFSRNYYRRRKHTRKRMQLQGGTN
ncbi:hypothetical protein J2Z43_000201 [Clostridioides mangenotii]|uniref:Uncharacterized protein n=1 Tax=Metaclostridioides mangenotii TaxID=1540 RepID=A0ABS4E791_9FIRM|nr:hypothetical protein [Clostridioides mangenotii]